jgi:hypothetical protein
MTTGLPDDNGTVTGDQVLGTQSATLASSPSSRPPPQQQPAKRMLPAELVWSCLRVGKPERPGALEIHLQEDTDEAERIAAAIAWLRELGEVEEARQRAGEVYITAWERLVIWIDRQRRAQKTHPIPVYWAVRRRVVRNAKAECARKCKAAGKWRYVQLDEQAHDRPAKRAQAWAITAEEREAVDAILAGAGEEEWLIVQRRIAEQSWTAIADELGSTAYFVKNKYRAEIKRIVLALSLL